MIPAKVLTSGMRSKFNDVAREKEEVSTDLKSTIEEVSRDKEEVSTDLKSTIEKFSTHLKESNYEDWIPNVTKLVECLGDFCDQHFLSSIQQKISDIEHQIGLCIQALELVPKVYETELLKLARRDSGCSSIHPSDGSLSLMQEVAGKHGGHLHGRGALDSDDLLYLKEQMETEEDVECLLR
ncbi:hypothetical protein MTR67_044332 [Solanum verrucosum]|uniref:Uncharacterized protein n=1 Tax=Solanum verrucosum TaxID=315347 RepID=A0AAF0UR31_SOLVR|nr:hypothetical protein MTR67_044332 [Solanum verrucosum]